MWHGMAVASRPSARIAPATSSHLSALRLDTTTPAPARASASAIERPMPLVEPVTTADLPVRSNNEFVISLLGVSRQTVGTRRLSKDNIASDSESEFQLRHAFEAAF